MVVASNSDICSKARSKLKAVKCICGRESNYQNSPPFFSVQICVCMSVNIVHARV